MPDRRATDQDQSIAASPADLRNPLIKNLGGPGFSESEMKRLFDGLRPSAGWSFDQSGFRDPAVQEVHVFFRRAIVELAQEGPQSKR